MLFVLFLIVFNLSLAYYMTIITIPEFVKQLKGKSIDIGLLISIQYLTQIIFSPLWGKLSDKYGRKPFVIIGMLGYPILFHLTAIVDGIGFLIFIGILGGIILSATMPSILAYACDISNNERRNITLGIVGGSFWLGTVIGPFVGGAIGYIDIRTAFIFSFFVFLLNSALVLILLKEKKLKVIEGKGTKILNGYTIFSSIVYLILFATSVQVILGIFSNYKSYKYVLYIIFIGTLFGAISQLAIGYIIKFLSEKFLIVFSIFLLSVAVILMGFINNPALFYILMSVYGFFLGLSLTNLIARASKRISDEHQGELMGIIQAFGSLGRFLGSIVFAYLYSLNPLLPYLLSGIILILVAILTIKWI